MVDRQLEAWVKGMPRHNTERDECCPDFSCCRPELLAPVKLRRKFIQAGEVERHGMLLHFLAAALSAAAPSKKVYIAGQGSEN